MDDLRRLEAKGLARAKVRSQRRRVATIRRRTIRASLALFALFWAIIFSQLVSGNDPVLSRIAASGRPGATATERENASTAPAPSDEARASAPPEPEAEFEPEAEAEFEPEAEAEFEPEAEAEFEPAPEEEFEPAPEPSAPLVTSSS